MSIKIYVGGLPFYTTEIELGAIFRIYGEVSSASLTTDLFTGHSRGLGFVEMPDEVQAAAAIRGLNGSELDGHKLSASKTLPGTPQDCLSQDDAEQ